MYVDALELHCEASYLRGGKGILAVCFFIEQRLEIESAKRQEVSLLLLLYEPLSIWIRIIMRYLIESKEAPW